MKYAAHNADTGLWLWATYGKYPACEAFVPTTFESREAAEALIREHGNSNFYVVEV